MATERDRPAPAVDHQAAARSHTDQSSDGQQRYLGHDRTGMIRAVADRHGRIIAVDVAASWRDRISPDSLAEAVLSAVRDAVIRRDTAWAATITAGPHEQAADPTALAVTRDLAEELRHAHDLLHATAATVTGHPPPEATATATATAGTATVTVTATTVITVTIDHDKLTTRTPDAIAADLTAAFDTAYRTADAARDRTRAPTPSTDRLHQSIQDADTTMRQLGLTPP